MIVVRPSSRQCEVGPSLGLTLTPPLSSCARLLGVTSPHCEPESSHSPSGDPALTPDCRYCLSLLDVPVLVRLGPGHCVFGVTQRGSPSFSLFSLSSSSLLLFRSNATARAPDAGRCGEIWGDAGRCGEMWGDTPLLGRQAAAPRDGRAELEAVVDAVPKKKEKTPSEESVKTPFLRECQDAVPKVVPSGGRGSGMQRQRRAARSPVPQKKSRPRRSG